jgi:hypothetical protein
MPPLPLLNLVKPVVGAGLSLTGAVLARVPGPVGAAVRDLRTEPERPQVAVAPVKRWSRVNAEKPAPPIAEATPAELAELGEGRQPAPFGSTSA